MATTGPSTGAVLRPLVVASAILVAACAPAAAPRSSPPVGTSPVAIRDNGVTVAENAGATLIVLSLDPGETGDNTLTVDVLDPAGVLVPGSVRADLSIDRTARSSTTLPAGDRRRSVAVPSGGQAELRVVVLDGKAAGADVTFALTLPVERAAIGILGDIDRSMRALHTVREVETLSGGGPVLLFHFEYAAPDRVRYTTVRPAGPTQETRLIGRDRFDSVAGGPWTHSDTGFVSPVPATDYARGSTRVRVIGRERDGPQDVIEIAFVQAPDVYYRVWAGAQDHLARRSVMMTRGHYMTGTYSDYDVPIAISAP